MQSAAKAVFWPSMLGVRAGIKAKPSHKRTELRHGVSNTLHDHLKRRERPHARRGVGNTPSLPSVIFRRCGCPLASHGFFVAPTPTRRQHTACNVQAQLLCPSFTSPTTHPPNPKRLRDCTANALPCTAGSTTAHSYLHPWPQRSHHAFKGPYASIIATSPLT